MLVFSRFSIQQQSPVSASYFPVPKALSHFVFGYHEVTADLFWIRTLQDFDYCEKKSSEGICVAKGWVYQVLDLTCDLSPTFLQPHAWGALALSVLVGDKEGAALIFARAVERFSTNWSVSYWAGYHAMLEEQNPEKAAGYLENAARNGAPPWVYSLVAKLYTQVGKQELAEGLIKNLEDANFDPIIIKRMRQRLQQNP